MSASGGSSAHGPSGPPDSDGSGRASGWAEWAFSGVESAPDQPALGAAAVPDRIGPYELVDKLAEGAMGVVYRARDPSLRRLVALKAIRPGTATGPAQLERFRREVQATARLRHPNIVQIHGANVTDDTPYLVMDLIEGESLAARLERTGPLPGRDAAAIALKLARALEHAHGRGVLHRDVKPRNVLLDVADEPCLTDFGLARLAAQGPRVTGSRDMIGTPGFMAPELAGERHAEVDERADIYSLGATLFAMLTGRPPLIAATLLEFLDRLATEPIPRPSTLRRGIDPELEAICMACLAKAPAERYASAAELADDLGRFLSGVELSSRAEGLLRAAERGRTLQAVAWGGVVLLVGVGVGLGAAALVLRATSPATEPTTPSAGAADGTEVALLRLGASQEAAGKPAAAVETYRKAAAAAATSPEPLRALARAALAAKQPEEASRALARVVELAPQDPADWLALARARRGVGDTRGALAACDHVLARRADHGEAWLERAEISRAAGDDVQAQADLGKAVDLGTKGAALARSELRARAGQLDGALADLELAVAQEPDRRELWLRLADLYEARRDLPAALDALTRATQHDPKHARAWADRARLREMAQDLHGALEDADRAVAADERLARSWLARASALRGLGRFEEAIAGYDCAIELDPTIGAAYNNRAGLLLDLGQSERALEDYDRALALEPTNALLVAHRAIVFRRTGQPDRALAEADRALTIDPTCALALVLRANGYAERGETQRALADTQRALQFAPNDVEALRLCASLHAMQSHWRDALGPLDRLLSVAPQHPEGLYLRGLARAYTGERSGAIADLEAFLRVGPHDATAAANARRALADLRNGR